MHEQVFHILDTINTVILICIGVPFFLQLFYMLLFFIPKKTFKRSEKINRIAVIIPAHNEEDVIYDTIKALEKQKYPRDMFDVYVIADNCTDKTIELAQKAGAKIYIHNDDNPKHHIVGYALKYGFKKFHAFGAAAIIIESVL